jgi:RecB family endonuclease NucS
VSAAVRLIVARCEVVYTGRLSAMLPESTRLLMLKSDGSVLVHADAGGYKPLNWMKGTSVRTLRPSPRRRLTPAVAESYQRS